MQKATDVDCRRRLSAHVKAHAGNYGFQFTFMDRLFGTRLPADAADPQIAAWRRRQERRAQQG